MSSQKANEWKEKVKNYESEYLNQLKEFLSINSIEDMSTATEGKPFGDGVAQALEYMLELGKKDGFKTKNLDGYAGYIEYGEGEEEVGVLVHVDVVTVGDDWTTPPFSPDIRNGRIYARGAIDDKGPAMTAYYALKMVKDAGIPLSKRIRFIIGTDEESGWLCMQHYSKVEKMPEIGFSPDADFPLIHAEKGQINPTITLDNSKFPEQAASEVTLRSFVAGDQANSVPEKAKAIISFVGKVDEKTIESAYSEYVQNHQVTGEMTIVDEHTIEFFLKGRAAHGMEPFVGVNAGTMLSKFLLSDSFGYSFTGKDQAFLHFLGVTLHEDFYGENLGIHCEDEVTGKLTVNPGILHYDQSEGAMVKLNIRYPATISVDERRELVEKQLPKFGWAVTNMRTSKAHYVPKDHPVIEILSKVYEEHAGKPAELLTTGGATYAKTMSAGVAFGPVFPGKEGTAHQRDEYAEIDDLLSAMAIYAQAMSELAK